jgi:DNA-binding IclR family transcriptional regulator
MIKLDDEIRYRAPALDKGLDILELLAQQPKGMTRAEIEKAMGRRPSEIYRMLERLVMRQYVSRSTEGDRYALTMKLFLLGSEHPPMRRMVAQAMPLMDEFADLTQQSIHMVAPDRGIGVVIAQASGRANWEFRLRLGSKLDLLTTGSGHALLAFQTPEHRSAMLQRQPSDSENIAADWRCIEDELNDVRKMGFRIGKSIQLLGVQDISVPILSPKGYSISVLTCPYIERLDRADGDDTQKTLARMRIVADNLSVRLAETEPDKNV